MPAPPLRSAVWLTILMQKSSAAPLALCLICEHIPVVNLPKTKHLQLYMQINLHNSSSEFNFRKFTKHITYMEQSYLLHVTGSVAGSAHCKLFIGEPFSKCAMLSLHSMANVKAPASSLCAKFWENILNEWYSHKAGACTISICYRVSKCRTYSLFTDINL